MILNILYILTSGCAPSIKGLLNQKGREGKYSIKTPQELKYPKTSQKQK